MCRKMTQWMQFPWNLEALECSWLICVPNGGVVFSPKPWNVEILNLADLASAILTIRCLTISPLLGRWWNITLDQDDSGCVYCQAYHTIDELMIHNISYYQMYNYIIFDYHRWNVLHEECFALTPLFDRSIGFEDWWHGPRASHFVETEVYKAAIFSYCVVEVAESPGDSTPQDKANIQYQ